MKQFAARTTTFLKEVQVELTKVSWPTRQELIDSTKIVLMSSALLAVFIGVCDSVISVGVRWLFRLFE